MVLVEFETKDGYSISAKVEDVNAFNINMIKERYREKADLLRNLINHHHVSTVTLGDYTITVEEYKDYVLHVNTTHEYVVMRDTYKLSLLDSELDNAMEIADEDGAIVDRIINNLGPVKSEQFVKLERCL